MSEFALPGGWALAERLGRRAKAAIVATVAVTSVAVGAAGHNIWSPFPPPAPPPPAGVHVWVNVTGSDSTCVRDDQSKPCATLNRAYQIAQQGDTVEIAGGTYGGQTIQRDSSKSTSTDVVFQPASGSTVVVSSQLHIQGNHLTLDGSTGAGGRMRIATFEIETASCAQLDTVGPTSDVTLKNIDATGGQSQVQTARDVLIQNVEFGDQFTDNDGLKVVAQFGPSGSETCGSGDLSDEPTNIVFDGIEMHDVRRANSGSTAHVDCVQYSSGVNVTFRNSKFWHCSTQGLFIQEFNGSITDVTVENNMFGPCPAPDDPTGVSCTSNLILSGGVDDALVRNNSFALGPSGLRIDAGLSNVRVVGNAGEGATCFSGIIYSHNVWDDADCGATDVTADPGFVDSTGGDYDLHLASASGPASGAGDPANFPSTDFDGDSRTSPPDAGADER